jgi:hypothetical protein
MFALCFDRSRRRVGFGSQLELWQILFLLRFSSSFISDFHLLPWACTPSQSRFPIRFYSSRDRIPRPGFISALRSISSIGADLGPCSNPLSLLLVNSEEQILLCSYSRFAGLHAARTGFSLGAAAASCCAGGFSVLPAWFVRTSDLWQMPFFRSCFTPKIWPGHLWICLFVFACHSIGPRDFLAARIQLHQFLLHTHPINWRKNN